MRFYLFWDFTWDFEFLVEILNVLIEVLKQKVPVNHYLKERKQH